MESLGLRLYIQFPLALSPVFSCQRHDKLTSSLSQLRYIHLDLCEKSDL